MSNRILALLVLSTLIAPSAAHAGVVINEIAWMGTTASDTDEWIELYNDGTEEVSFSGWTIASSGTAPNITLTGSIAGGGYYLLERTDDTTVPGVAANKIYTGALSNGGDTLTLKDASGAAVDVVAGGSDWKSIGGNNSTKATAQRAGSGWVTATATPGAINAVGSEEDSEDEEEGEGTGTTTPVVTVGGTAPSTSSSAQSPRRTISLDAGNDRIVLAQVPTPYSAIVYSKNERAIDDADIVWNFGDGVRQSGEEVTHAYESPGEYVLSVRARYEDAEVLRTHKVVVEESRVRVQTDDQGVRLTNDGTRLADISGWKLTDGEDTFVLPPDTAVWAGSTITLLPKVTGLATGTPVSLLFPEGAIAATAAPLAAQEREAAAEPTTEKTQNIATVPQKPAPSRVGIQQVRTVDLPAPVSVQAHEEVIEAPAAATQQAAAGAALVPSKTPAWLMCLLGNILACSAALVVR